MARERSWKRSEIVAINGLDELAHGCGDQRVSFSGAVLVDQRGAGSADDFAE